MPFPIMPILTASAGGALHHAMAVALPRVSVGCENSPHVGAFPRAGTSNGQPDVFAQNVHQALECERAVGVEVALCSGDVLLDAPRGVVWNVDCDPHAFTHSMTALSSSYLLTLAARYFAGAAAGLAWALLAGHAHRMVARHQQGHALAIAMVGTPIALVSLADWLTICCAPLC
jgi:hypothetical protein